MDVLYTCDNNYIWLMGISAISLFENNRDIKELTVYLLGENISAENKTKLQEISIQYSRQIIVIDVPQLNIPVSLVSTRWPISAFSRLYSAELLPSQIDTVLYLDCDTIVNKSIKGLEAYHMGQLLAYGVKDCIGGAYKRNIGLAADADYINAGVLLLNIRELRKIDINSVIDTYLKRYINKISYADQDILNGIFQHKIGILPPAYNVMTIDFAYSWDDIRILRKPTNYYRKDEFSSAITNPIILHYTTNMCIIRPWYSNSDHPKRQIFESFRAISPWKNRKLTKTLMNSRKDRILRNILKLPRPIALHLLGFIHAVIVPAINK